MRSGQRLRPPLVLLVLVGLLAASGTGAAVTVGRRDEARTGTPAPVPTSGTTAVPANTDDPTQGSLTETQSTATAPRTAGGSASSSDPPRTARACPELKILPLRAKLAQLLFVGVSSAQSAAAALDGSDPAGGVLVLGRRSTWFANGVLKQIAASAAVPPVVAADEEGGRVQRIDGVVGSMPSARAMGQMPVPRVRQIAADRGRHLRELGFTMDFAPVLDLHDSSNAVINDRAFASDPARVTRYGRAFAEGLSAAGIAPVLKHFPGHGRSTGDSHREAVRTPSLEELRATDLKPFVALSGSVPAVMVGHLDVPGLTTPGRPTSVSAEAIDGLLRQQLRFKGLVITDDLSGMKAITNRFTIADAVITSITAGADVAIVAFGTATGFDALLTALESAVATGRLSKARVEAALDHLRSVKPGCR